MEFIVRTFDGCCVERRYQYHEIESLSANTETTRPHDIVFVTGNKNKVKELEGHIKLKSTKLTVLDLDLPEIQDSEILNIVQDKCKRAFNHINNSSNLKRSVLVEDTCLNFHALNGMPGPYIKWFLKAMGVGELPKLLASYEDKTAEAVCIYALMEEESYIVFCKGSVRGKITHPKGSSWGWDAVFQEDRSGLTFGEMDPSMKSKFSHRSNAITVLRKYLSIGGIAL